MNYNEYKLWKEEYLKNNNPFRADCLNPFKSMNYLIKDIKFKDKEISINQLLNSFLEVSKIDINY